MKENIDYVICKICGKKYRELQTHLKLHNISSVKYKDRYKSPIICEEKVKLSVNGLLKWKEKHPNEVKRINIETAKRTHRKWRERDPEGYHKRQSKAGKKGVEKLEEWKKDNWDEFIKMVIKNLDSANKANKRLKETGNIGFHNARVNAGKKSWEYRKKLYPNFSEIMSIVAKNTHKEHPDLAHRLGVITQTKHPNIAYTGMLKWCRETPKEYIEMCKNNARKARKTIREGKPYIYKNTHFDSNEERECAKILLDKPIDDINCHVYVNGKIIDFYLEEQNLFIEYHPADWRGLSDEEYYQERMKAINNSEYKGTDLVVIKNLDDAELLKFCYQEC